MAGEDIENTAKAEAELKRRSWSRGRQNQGRGSCFYFRSATVKALVQPSCRLRDHSWRVFL